MREEDIRRPQHEAVRLMTEVPGWQIVSRFIALMADNAREQLTKNEFTDLRQVGFLQGQVHACQTILGAVASHVRAALASEKEGGK